MKGAGGAGVGSANTTMSTQPGAGEEEEGGEWAENRKRKGRKEMKTNISSAGLVSDKAGPFFSLLCSTSLSDTCKVNIWYYTWRFHMLISVICASIKICRYYMDMSERGGKKQILRKLLHRFTEQKKNDVHIIIIKNKRSEISKLVTEMSPTSPFFFNLPLIKLLRI